MKNYKVKVTMCLRACFALSALLFVLLLAACSQSSQPNNDKDIKPATPAGFTVTAGDAQVGLAWSANSEEDLKHYNVYQGTVQAMTY